MGKVGGTVGYTQMYYIFRHGDVHFPRTLDRVERKRIRERRKAEIGRKLKGGEQGIGDVVERRGRYCLPRVLEGETE